MAWKVLLSAAFLLVAAMAGLTAAGAHPDEKASIGAVRFYETRWFPADIRDPAAAPSFSGYGVSRLDQKTIFWNVAGKASRIARALLPRWQAPERALNVLLFAAIAALCLRRGATGPWLCLLIGLSPQVWYLFSYCTSDAWDLLLGVAAFNEVASRRSLFWRGVLGPRGPASGGAWLRRSAGIIASGCLFGILSLGKPTVLAAFLVCGIVVARRLANLPAHTVRRIVPALVSVALVAAAWPAAAAISEHARYGSRHGEIRMEMAERHRHADFIPDERGITAYPSVNLRGRGVAFKDAILHQVPPFLPTTLASFAGSYGPMTYPSPRPWYAAIAACWAALLAIWCARFVKSRPCACDILTALSLMAVPLLLLAASAWHSWTADYQPQGRYLFPSNTAWAALGTLVAGTGRPGGMAAKASTLIFTLMLALGLWSFLFYGLIPMAADNLGG